MATDVIQIKYEADLSQLQAQLKDLKQQNSNLIKQEKELGAAATKAGNDAATAASRAGAETDKLAGKTKQVDGSFSQLGKTIGAAFALDRVRAFVTEAVKAAAAAEGIEAAFNRIAPEGTLDKLRQATKNTVSDVQLMTAAVKANNFQLPLQNLPKFFEFAQKRARETGESVDYLVESIVLGIGRKSPLILDNLGISAVRLREKFKGISDEQVDVAAVSQAVEEIVSEELVKMGTSATTTADKIAQWGAAFENIKVKAGEFFIIFGTFIEEYVKNISWKEIFDPFGLFFGEARGKAEDAIELMKKEKETQDLINQGYHEAKEAIKSMSDEEARAYYQSRKFETEKSVGVKKAVKEQIEARKAARESEKQYNTASIKELEAWIALGDSGAQKELNRRKKAEVEAQKARDAAIKADQRALAERLKESEKYYDGLENLQKEKFLNNEISEEELSKAIADINFQRLAGQTEVLSGFKAKTVEVQKQLEDELYNVQSKSLDELVTYQKNKQAEVEKAEKERLANVLKAHDEYWQKVAAVNVQMLDAGVITQEEYDKITEEQQKQSLLTRIALYKDFEGKTEAINEEVNKGLLADQKALNDKIVEDNRKKNDKLVEDDEKAKEQRKRIQQELYSQAQNLLSNFVDFALKQTQAETDAKLKGLEREEAAIDQKLQNEIIGEQQAEAAKNEINQRRRELLTQQAQRDKQAAIAQAVINGAAAVINALATGGPAAPVLAAIVGAAAAAQLALMVAAPLPQYKDGVIDLQGPGTETSDSIVARLSKGESVIRARATRKYKEELKVINKGDDSFQEYIRTKYVMPELESLHESESDRIEKVVKQVLVNANKFNDKNIVKSIDQSTGRNSRDLANLGQYLGNKIESSTRGKSFKDRRK